MWSLRSPLRLVISARPHLTQITKRSNMDYVKNTIAENLGGPAQELTTNNFSLGSVPDQSGKVALITGGSEGIGYACSHTLLSRNVSKLYILSTSKEAVDGARSAIAEELGQELANRTHWLECDLSNWERVSEVTQEVTQSTDRLDILINNAGRGIMTYQLAENGVDRHMSVNHFGHVILTSHLLPLMLKTAGEGQDAVRVVNLSSNLHESSPSDTKFADLNELNQDLGPNGQYARAKLATLLYARYMSRNVTAQHPKVLFNATHPGIVSTKMSTEDIHEPYPLGGYAMSTLMEPFKKTKFEGALSTLYAATVTNRSGAYICPPAVEESGSKLSQDEALGDQLMAMTRSVVKDKTKPKSEAEGCPFDDTSAMETKTS